MTDRLETVEIPHLLLGFLAPDTFIGVALSDTGRGTFTLTGNPMCDPEIVDELAMEPNETAIEVPVAERSFYGATTAA
ncbi:hypothetical protein ACFXG4_13620 [Nocardia sp. NPDC059246]|uniref:hypothetical protein n=1 Tax=unclassified Nocardia TaxID=2637762 RepID=UPI0036BD05BA